MNPANFMAYWAIFGFCLEMCLAPLSLFAPKIGLGLAISMHLYILSMLPFASVMEWNLVCLYIGIAVFGIDFDGYLYEPLPETIHPALLLFFFVSLFLIPLLGNIYPAKIPFLLAMRPYMGNWRFTWHIVSRKAEDKLRYKLELHNIYDTYINV